MVLILLTIVAFLLILSVLVLIHEAGHYFVAKKLGIKVEEFGFGFPLTPALFSFKKGETLYSFYPVLIGGFVKLYGEDEAGAGRITTKTSDHHTGKKDDLRRAFFSRPLWQRMSVIIAGVVMNVILAVVIYYAFLGISDFKTALPLLSEDSPPFILVNKTVLPSGIAIGKVAPHSPAENAGIKAPSILISVNGKKINSDKELVNVINANKGKEIIIAWFDVTKEQRFMGRVTPRVSPPKNEGALGIAFDFSPYTIAMLRYDTPTQKLLSGFSHAYNMNMYNLYGLGYLIQKSIQSNSIKPIGDNVSGPVGISVVVGKVIEIPDLKERILQILNLTGILSLSLAFFNVLPIPGLDGGRLFFIVLEAIIGRKIDQKVEGYIHTVGMMLLIALIILVTIKDINQYVGQFFR